MPPPRLPPTLFDVSCAEAAALCLAGLRNCDQLWTPPKPGEKLLSQDRAMDDIPWIFETSFALEGFEFTIDLALRVTFFYVLNHGSW